MDGKVIFGADGGELFVFRHDLNPETINELAVVARDEKEHRALRLQLKKRIEAKYLIGKYELDGHIKSTPVVANGVLYVATDRTLYAFGP